MLDPVVLKAISIGFGLLFLLAAIHKISALAEFSAILRDYQVLPDSLLKPIATIVPVLEIALGAGWILLDQTAFIAIASSLLLALYTAAIAINLRRGRVHIGCGCGVAGTGETDQPLSAGLVVRTLLLMALALSAAMPVLPREFAAMDYVTLLAAVIAGALLYISGNQLLGNSAAINTWRNRRG
jgi:hypothetical protein